MKKKQEEILFTKELVDGFVRRAYHTACEHGFHDEEHSDEHWMMLVVSEIGEMMEADRKNRRAARNKMEQVMSLDAAAKNSFDHYFELFIKDTLEDELADVCIRLFDFCGMRGVLPLMTDHGIVDMSESFERLYGDLSITELCFGLTEFTVEILNSDNLSRDIGVIVAFCVEFARYHNIDLVWHIEQKMKYNESRPKKHGKKY